MTNTWSVYQTARFSFEWHAVSGKVYRETTEGPTNDATPETMASLVDDMVNERFGFVRRVK